MGKGIDITKLRSKIRFGKDDVPDDYGTTKKMYAIYQLVDSGKTLDDADFEVNEYDRAYFEIKKREREWALEKGQKPIRFVNDF